MDPNERATPVPSVSSTHGVKTILDLEDGWQTLLPSAVTTDETFTRYRAVHATMLFMSGVIGDGDARLWADFILGQKNVRLESDYQYELSEFLHDWSSSGASPVNRDTVDVWQSRFAHD